MPQVTGGAQISSSGQVATGSITSDDILDGTIVNADISDTAAIARSKIVAAAGSGANSDITSLSGLTTPLSVAQGGTGAATLGDAGVLIGNGTSAVQVTGAGTAGQVLTSNGAGNDPTFQTGGGVSKITAAGAATVINDDNTAEQNIVSVSIPGGTLGTNNAIRVRIYLTAYAETNSVCAFKLQYGTTTLATISTTDGGGFTTPVLYMEAVLFANAATNAQRGILLFSVIEQQLSAVTTAVNHSQGVSTGTATEDSTGALTLKVTADYDVNGTSTFTVIGYTVEKIA